MKSWGGNSDRSKLDVSLTLVDYYDTAESKLKFAKHKKSVGCRCKESDKKRGCRNVEAKWTYRMGATSTKHGLTCRRF